MLVGLNVASVFGFSSASSGLLPADLHHLGEHPCQRGHREDLRKALQVGLGGFGWFGVWVGWFFGGLGWVVLGLVCVLELVFLRGAGLDLFGLGCGM